MINSRTYAQIDLDALAHNVKIITGILRGGSKLMAVVKADAYGHGAVFAAREFAACGVDFFGVSSVDEAVQLRENGITQNILVLGYTVPNAENANKLIKHNITQTIFDPEQIRHLSELAGSRSIKAHIKINTGMNRLGFSWTEKNKDFNTVDSIKKTAGLKNIELEGIFTHFADADNTEPDFTNRQFELFCEIIMILKNENIYFKFKHAANSAAALNFGETHLDIARCGLVLYGLYPKKNMRDIGLVPAMRLKTTVSQILKIKQGETVSYSRSYTAPRDLTAAALPIGYADGFLRSMSNSAEVIINGKHAPVIGRVCMDQCVVDVSNCGDVKPGDSVTVFGREGGECIGVEQLADIGGSINYEVVCLVGKRVPRIYYKNGQETGYLNYIKPQVPVV